MHYLPKLLNENRFFLHLASLNPNPKSSANLANKIDRFLYRGTCALQSMLAMKHSLTESEKLGLEYKEQLRFDSKNRVPFACSELFLAYAQIPATLSSIVIMQNQLLRLISAIIGQGKNIPKSMNDAFKKGIEKFGFDEQLTKLLNDYWNNGGKYIREVRDVNEHFDALVDYTFFEFKNNVGTVLIFLPDNPETKSPKKFTYKLEKNAINVLYDGIKAINELLASICELKAIPKGKFQPSIIVNQVANLNENAEKTLGVFISVEQIIDGARGLYTMELKQKRILDNGQPELEFRKLKTDKEL
jgi:hypothetical protein